MFEVMYHLPYNGHYTFKPQLLMPADNLVVYAAKGIDFSAGQGATFQSTQEDPRVQTYVAKSIHPGQAIGFTLSGEGQMPAQARGQAWAAGRHGRGAGHGRSPAARPGGGIGAPIDSPDPLTKYKWWILGALTLLLIAGSAYFLRRKGDSPTASLPVSPEETFDPRARPIARGLCLNLRQPMPSRPHPATQPCSMCSKKNSSPSKAKNSPALCRRPSTPKLRRVSKLFSSAHSTASRTLCCRHLRAAAAPAPRRRSPHPSGEKSPRSPSGNPPACA